MYQYLARGTCPTTPVSLTFNKAYAYDAGVSLSKTLSLDYWADSLFNIGVRNNCIVCLSFDQGVGIIAYDQSGNGNNATLYGAALPTWVTGKYGRGA